MGGGGTAPKMKMSDAFILTGLTLLLGGLFMHAWVTPINHKATDPPYANGASLMWGDQFNFDITVENETIIRIVFKNETGGVISADSVVLAAGELHQHTLAAPDAGYYSYEIDTKETGAIIYVEIERKLMLDMLPFPVGALILAMGLYQRSAAPQAQAEESIPTEVMDAVLDD